MWLRFKHKCLKRSGSKNTKKNYENEEMKTNKKEKQNIIKNRTDNKESYTLYV